MTILRAGLGAFFGIAVIAWAAELGIGATDSIFLIGSFGATAVLLYAAPTAVFSRARNVVGGHVLSALVGVAVMQTSVGPQWLAAALAVSIAVMAMQITHTVHPPGGATALIAVIGSPRIKELGFAYAVFPVLAGVLMMLGVAYLSATLGRASKLPAGR
jgi:CBS-domain-containing membrane protein